MTLILFYGAFTGAISLRSFGGSGVAITLGVLAIIAIYKTEVAAVLMLVSPLSPDFARRALNISAVTDVSLAFSLFCISFIIRVVMHRRKMVDHFSLRFWKLYAIAFLVFLYESFLATQGIESVSATRALITYTIAPTIILSSVLVTTWLIKNNKSKYLYGAVIVTVASMIISYGLDKITYGFSNKIKGGYIGTGNTIASILVISLPFLFLIRHKSKSGFVKCLPLAAIAVIVTSRSRGSNLALLATALFWFLFYANISKRSKQLLSFISLVGVFYLSRELWNESLMQISASEAQQYNEVSSGRYQIWKTAMHHLRDIDHILYGSGPREFLTLETKHNTQNHVLLLLINVGIFGTLAILSIYLRLLREAKSYLKSLNVELIQAGKVVILTSIAAAVVGCFSHFAVGSKQLLFYWISIGYFSAVIDLAQIPTAPPPGQKLDKPLNPQPRPRRGAVPKPLSGQGRSLARVHQ